jgi:hypothetical protein
VYNNKEMFMKNAREEIKNYLEMTCVGVFTGVLQ